MKTRLFIGNLASTVSEQELRDKFEALLTSHKGEAEVGNAEVRCKNENNYFGFVDIHLHQKGSGGETGGNNGIPAFLRKYVDLMNNTKWKGSLIKVQVAKESFIDRLKREQQENRDKGGTENSAISSGSNGMARGASGQRNVSEINNSEQSRNQRQANDILNKLNRSRDRAHRSNQKSQDRNPNRTENISSADCGFEIVGRNHVAKQSPQKPFLKNSSLSTKDAKKRSRKSKSSSSDDDSDDEVRDGIPKFKGLLLCYPEGLPTAPPSTHQPKPELQQVTIEEEKLPAETEIQNKLLSIALNKDVVTQASKLETVVDQVRPNKSAINFKKSKQQKSDLLRLQSLEKMKELKAQRKNLIKSSLSTVSASAPVSEQRKVLGNAEEEEEDGEQAEPTSKKAKMTLFDNTDDEDGDEEDSEADEFKVKKQFEGTGGQKLLELKTRWGNDDRFKIDDRFKESDDENDSVEPVEQEKEKQLDILTGILGKVVSIKNAPAKGKKGSGQTTTTSVIMPRYDPEAEETNLDEDKSEDPKKKKPTKGEDNATATDVAEKVVRSNEPATFKTVSNLKALFSSSTTTDGNVNDSGKESSSLLAASVPEQQNSFSLLATFGKKTNDDAQRDDGSDKKKGTSTRSSAEGPRSFWQSNPFRYDSSDDEGDNVKITIKSQSEKSTPSLVVHGKASFFFTKNDARFDGLEDYFLKGDEISSVVNGDDNKAGTRKDLVEDFAIKRQELKSIVKAKIRNSRRKDEKRTLAIKRAIRKRKRKMQQKGRIFSK